MYNQMNAREKLPTNRTFGMLMLRGVCSFAILGIIEMFQMQRDLNTIVKPYTRKRSNFLFFGKRTYKLINAELARRKINYKLKKFFNGPWRTMEALNLLCEDYNKSGC